MATTSFTLGEHREVFMKNQIASGKYGAASELVRDGLRLLERRETKIAALQKSITEGFECAIVENFSMDELQKELDSE
ncbi:type II toxin-antitoxin system ParD family antitoxin [Methyloprofundus sp.]|uniref:type II toxin-antitoxin system ParD family antitoxin n=1 Tax=Methyloprofundus sp. TaxID=2020875 RepID=UPI003D0E1E82